MSRVKQIPYGHQTISRQDINAVIHVLKSEFLTQGPTIGRFEKAIASYCGTNYAVALSSGTAALHAACFAAGIKPGDEVITTPMTFVASANCVLYCGGTPVFADIKKDVPLIDPDEIRKKITKKTKAVIPVDYSGMPVDYDEINQIAKKHKLVVIADAAHSLGATYKRQRVGKLADMTVFSFHPVKSITTGEGGMVVTNNKKYYQKLLLFRTHGITRNQNLLIQKNNGPWYYEMQELGFNYRMTDIQAGLGLSQLQKLDKFISTRNKLATKYIKRIKQLRNVSSIPIPSDRTSSWHLFPVVIKHKLIYNNKKKIVMSLHKAGIIVQIHYIPVHMHPFYQKIGYKPKGFPNSEEYYRNTVTLPLYPKLTEKDQDRIISTLKSLTKDKEGEHII